MTGQAIRELRMSEAQDAHVVCGVAGCERPVKTTYACLMHRRRFAKFGMYDLPPKPTVEDRFWSKVRQCPDGCWLWTGSIDSTSGYGKFAESRKKFWNAHRFALSLREPLIEGLTVDHLCRVRACVNPEHLEQVTSAENNARGLPFRRRATHCPAGHDYSVSGYRNKLGYYECRLCHRARHRKGGK